MNSGTLRELPGESVGSARAARCGRDGVVAAAACGAGTVTPAAGCAWCSPRSASGPGWAPTTGCSCWTPGPATRGWAPARCAPCHYQCAEVSTKDSQGAFLVRSGRACERSVVHSLTRDRAVATFGLPAVDQAATTCADPDCDGPVVSAVDGRLVVDVGGEVTPWTPGCTASTGATTGPSSWCRPALAQRGERPVVDHVPATRRGGAHDGARPLTPGVQPPDWGSCTPGRTALTILSARP